MRVREPAPPPPGDRGHAPRGAPAVVAPAHDLAPAGFFVLRTPLLPAAELHAMSDGLEAPSCCAEDEGALEAALERDRLVVRRRLQALLARPEIREALLVASASLARDVAVWEREPTSGRGLQVERALMRYASRMAGRATPFGLFAGCSFGRVSGCTRLQIGARTSYVRRTRLDTGYLQALCANLARDPALAAQLRYRPSSTLYPAAGGLRHVEERTSEGRATHHLVAIEAAPHLVATLARAAGGEAPAALARGLCADDPELEPSEAERFVADLIAGGVLVAELAVPVTGGDPLDAILGDLSTLGTPAAHARAVLGAAREALAALDRRGLGGGPERYGEIARRLEALPVRVDPSRLFHVDLFKPAPECTLGLEVVDEIARGVELLHRLDGAAAEPDLRRFREELERRYGGREVPLCEALDEECGVGFGAPGAHAAEPTPLLEGLVFPARARAAPSASPQDALLLRKLAEALRSGAQEIHLGLDDLKELAQEEPPPLPDAFAVTATLVGRGSRWRVHLGGVGGPSGASLLGRFCHGDASLAAHVQRHLRAEEAMRPEVVFAEVVHLPDGPAGNVVLRPTLRGYEIPYRGRSGVAAERQIPFSDLLVSVRSGRVQLRSRRLGSEVVPRLTTAHHFASERNPAAYRFLCSLQQQGLATPLAFRWGALAGLPFLPRVVSGRVVLSPMQWNLDAEQVRLLTRTRGAVRHRALCTLRRALQLPRWVAVADGDQLLAVDLENVVAVDAAAHVLRGRRSAALVEVNVSPEDLPAFGPEGRFVHELVLPFGRAHPRAVGPSVARGPAARAAPLRWPRWPPGSPWLYVKLYAGTAGAERVLREVVGPTIRSALASGAAEEWFFVRYADPDWHIRLRLRGVPGRLLAEVAPAIHDLATPLLEDGSASRVQIDTYEPELDRYGGSLGLELSERLFWVDSEAALAIVESSIGDTLGDVRWRLCLCGMDRLLQDLGLAPEAQCAVLERARRSLASELQVDRALERSLGDRYRRERSALAALLARGADPGESGVSGGSPIARGLASLRRRSERLAEIGAALRAADREGALQVPLADLAGSYLHMSANRILRADARAQELVLYDFLARVVRSRMARGRGTGGEPR